MDLLGWIKGPTSGPIAWAMLSKVAPGPGVQLAGSAVIHRYHGFYSTTHAAGDYLSVYKRLLNSRWEWEKSPQRASRSLSLRRPTDRTRARKRFETLEAHQWNATFVCAIFAANINAANQ